MHCYLRGLNHKTAPAALREKLSLTPDASRRVLSELSAAGVPEAVFLATCNRTEFYVAGASPERLAAVVQRVVRDIFPGSADIPDKCWYDAGYGDAVQHLLRVAAGLDSMVLGEPEILGQVRAAWELALQAGSTGLFFNEVFQRCFRVAKRVRTETGLSAGAVSLASVAHQTLTADLGDLAGKRAVILGTGEIAGQMAKYLAAADLQQLTIVSHSADRASEFASLPGARGVPVSGLPQALARADALVTATSCPTAVVTVATMPTEPGRVSMIDLAHPRNIAPAVGDLPGVTLHAIDDLRRRVEASLQQRRAQAPKAEAMVRREVCALAAWHCSRPLTQIVKDFRASFEQSRRVEMTYAAATLNEAQLAALDEASRRMAGKLLHEATLHLKSLDLRVPADRHRLDEIATLFALRPTAAAKPAWADLEAAD